MPSTYAHYRFGQEMAERCPAEAAEAIGAYRGLYDIGLHGPDLLFYYKPLRKNPVKALGSHMHAQAAKCFFGAVRERIPAAEQTAARAYLLGFVCHFALDSACHGYIADFVRATGVTHARIESEFDRTLLLREGKEPLSACLTAHIRADAENARVVAPLLGVTQTQAYKALRSMLFYSGMLRAPHAPKRALVDAALRFSGKYQSLHGMMIAKRPVPACAESNARLDALYAAALEVCAPLMRDYLRYLDKIAPLPAAFEGTFDPAGEGDVSVLSEKEARP